MVQSSGTALLSYPEPRTLNPERGPMALLDLLDCLLDLLVIRLLRRVIGDPHIPDPPRSVQDKDRPLSRRVSRQPRQIGELDVIRRDDLACIVTQEGKVDLVLLGEGLIGKGSIHADAEDRCAKASQAVPERAHLLGAGTGKGGGIKGQNQFLPFKLCKASCLPFGIHEGKIGRLLSHGEGHSLLLSPRNVCDTSVSHREAQNKRPGSPWAPAGMTERKAGSSLP